jgi:hypothetical protein
MQLDKSLVPELSQVGEGIDNQKLKKYKSPDNDHIPVEVIQEESNILLSESQKLINSNFMKEELSSQHCTYSNKGL